jgi:hypothetical protein
MSEQNDGPVTEQELAAIEARATTALADPDEERTCLRCREPMAAPEVDLEPTPLHDTCAHDALTELARDAGRLVRALREERSAAHAANELIHVFVEAMGDDDDRDALGKHVRAVWISWAREQPNPKPSWLVPWEGLGEADREVDRRIGEVLYRRGQAERERHVEGVAVQFRQMMAQPMPCGHTLGDLIGGQDDEGQPTVTKCGACLAERAARRGGPST